MADYFDLGEYTRPVATSSAQAQTWFTRGLLWAYGFNHEEAAHCFEQAIGADADCAMAHWGLAYALGPNYNKPWEAFDQTDLTTSVSRAFQATAAAARVAAEAAPVERALVTRWPPATRRPSRPGTARRGTPGTPTPCAGCTGRFRDDLDVAALFADALMNLTPWALWDLITGEPADGAATAEARPVLERAMETRQAGTTPACCTCTST